MDQVENKDRAENLQIGEICRCTDRREDCELEHILNILNIEDENFEHRIACLSLHSSLHVVCFCAAVDLIVVTYLCICVFVVFAYLWVSTFRCFIFVNTCIFSLFYRQAHCAGGCGQEPGWGGCGSNLDCDETLLL